jgi:putative ABC transport system substrate-binding protein
LDRRLASSPALDRQPGEPSDPHRERRTRRAHPDRARAPAALPAIYVSKEYIDAGGLIAYGPNYPDLYRRAAMYVDKILRGANPSSLPVEQPTKFELIINLKAARAIGLQVPMALMLRADEVIE